MKGIISIGDGVGFCRGPESDSTFDPAPGVATLEAAELADPDSPTFGPLTPIWLSELEKLLSRCIISATERHPCPFDSGRGVFPAAHLEKPLSGRIISTIEGG